MSKEQEFIEAIENALSHFEQVEKEISVKNAKDILHIRGLLDEGEAFTDMHTLIKDYVEAQMYRKIFGFLPFVNDLKSQLLDVLKMHQFNPVSWLHSTRLKRSHSLGDMPSDYKIYIRLKEINGSEHSGCEARFSTLEIEVRKIREMNEHYKTKNDQLEIVLKGISENYSKIETELAEIKKSLQLAQSENERLNLALLQKDQEIKELKAENQLLKSNKPLNPQLSTVHDSPKSNIRKSSMGIFG
jgi:hypothetical protein